MRGMNATRTDHRLRRDLVWVENEINGGKEKCEVLLGARCFLFLGNEVGQYFVEIVYATRSVLTGTFCNGLKDMHQKIEPEERIRASPADDLVTRPGR
jgi:hypothetical protein